MSIPKRPTPDLPMTLTQIYRARIDHEHAVAKAAVEALRKVHSRYAKCTNYPMQDVPPDCSCAPCVINRTLREIDASGWEVDDE